MMMATATLTVIPTTRMVMVRPIMTLMTTEIVTMISRMFKTHPFLFYDVDRSRY